MEYEINGKFLYYAFLSGSQQVLIHQEELNKINVFPVRDKDTGSNLASTIRAVIDNTESDGSYKSMLERISEAALIGARGNSGVIFAQFLHGLNSETKNKKAIQLFEFIETVKRSIPYVYNAVSQPVEGTMLTVIKDWSEYLSNPKEGFQDLKKVIIDSLEVLEQSLSQTTSKLKDLKKYGFVDAGAKGFVVFIKGVIDFIKNHNIRALNKAKSESISIIHSGFDTNDDQDLSYRYCTEAVIKELKITTDALKEDLLTYGDSVVVAGSEETCRFHVHTNKAAELFYQLKDTGVITYQKVDDMLRQKERLNYRKWNIALVTDSTCDLSQELIDFYQINVVPINLNFGQQHYLDKLTIQPDQFYDMLESEQEFPKTSQINERSFTNLYSQLASEYDAIISIHLSSKFSGTFDNAKKAGLRIQNEFNTPVHLIDSKNLSGGLGLLVLKAAQDIESGNSVSNIVEATEMAVDRTKIFVSVKQLKHMIRGGRVSKPAGIVANLLGINPVISMAPDGNSCLFGKTFSQSSSLKKIFKHVKTISKEKQIWNYVVLHAHNLEGAKQAEMKMKMITGKSPASVVNISPVIGMHAGNGTIAVSLMFNP